MLNIFEIDYNSWYTCQSNIFGTLENNVLGSNISTVSCIHIGNCDMNDSDQENLIMVTAPP